MIVSAAAALPCAAGMPPFLKAALLPFSPRQRRLKKARGERGLIRGAFDAAVGKVRGELLCASSSEEGRDST